MFRRCTTLLVIVGLFTSYLAAVPHAHGGGSAEDQSHHDARPHFHCGGRHHADHDHGHSHEVHGHAPQEQPHGNRPQPVASSEGQPLSNDLGGTDHDASANFVPITAVAVLMASRMESVASAWQLAVLVPADCGLNGNWPNLVSTPRWFPPDQVQDASGTYLSLRNLRI